MLNLIKNEFIKLHYKRKLIITLIVFSSICILCCIAFVKISKPQTSDSRIAMLTNYSSLLKNQKSKTTDDNKKAQLDSQISSIDQQITDLKSSKATDNTDWKASLTKNNATSKSQMENADDLSPETSKETYNKDIKINQYLIDHNIKPTKTDSFTSFDFIQYLFILIGSLFIPIIIAILAGDIVSSEYAPPTIKVLLSRPVSRNNVLLSKFFTAFISSVSIILSIELICFIVIGLIFGFGNSSYPMAIGTTFKKSIIDLSGDGNSLIPILGSSYIIPIWNYIVRLFLFEVLYILGCTSFFILLSTILKSSTLSMTLSIIITIALNILSQIPLFKNATPFFYTTYGSMASSIDSSLALTTKSTYVTSLFAVIFLLIWSFICVALAHTIFRKRDILI